MTKKLKTFEKLAFQASNKREAQDARKALIAQYGDHDAADADVIISLGGDGFMLNTLRRNMTLIRRGLPVYGMNQGTIGFLMNAYSVDDLHTRLAKAEVATIHPLKMTANGPGGTYEALAINEVSLLRQTRQTAHIQIEIDGRIRLERLIADGVLVATSAGSTAYNLSAHGPVVPLGAEILALTPISAFRPRRWRGALLKTNAKVDFTVMDPDKRPVSATADDQEFRNITQVSVEQDKSIALNLMFDEGRALDEKILQEQFAS